MLLVMLCAAGLAVDGLGQEELPGDGAAAPILVCLKGDEVSVSSDSGKTCLPTPLPEGCRAVHLAPSGGSAWLLAMMTEGSLLHRISWDGSRWVDGGPVLADIQKVESLHRYGDRTVLLCVDGNGEYRWRASDDDGRTWTNIDRDDLGGSPEFDEAAGLRSSAVKTAVAMEGSGSLNDADVWADPTHRLVAIAWAFGNSGPALPSGTRSRLLATDDGGKTWRLIEGPSGGEVIVLGLGGSGDATVGVLFTADISKTWVTFDLGATWNEQARPDACAIYGAPTWLASIPARFP